MNRQTSLIIAVLVLVVVIGGLVYVYKQGSLQISLSNSKAYEDSGDSEGFCNKDSAEGCAGGELEKTKCKVKKENDGVCSPGPAWAITTCKCTLSSTDDDGGYGIDF